MKTYLWMSSAAVVIGTLRYKRYKYHWVEKCKGDYSHMEIMTTPFSWNYFLNREVQRNPHPNLNVKKDSPTDTKEFKVTEKQNTLRQSNSAIMISVYLLNGSQILKEGIYSLWSRPL